MIYLRLFMLWDGRGHFALDTRYRECNTFPMSTVDVPCLSPGAHNRDYPALFKHIAPVGGADDV